jgi:NADH-quinone oxidoreductase subunit L
VIIALAGLGIGYLWFSRRPLWQPPSILENKYYVDEIYDATVVNPIKAGSTYFLWRFFDVLVIDGLVNYFGTIVRDMGSTLRMIQTGVTRNYAAIIAVSGLIIIGYLGHPYIWDIIKTTFWR